MNIPMDIWLIQTEENIQICPKSILGILWLQTHFESRHWEALATNQVEIPKEDIKKLLSDANSAGLQLNFLQNLCITKKF